jgi:recombination associated protein RdgC
MFKQATIFLITSVPHHELGEALQKAQFAPCAPSQEASAGWVPPRGEHEPIFEVINGEVIAKFVLERKVVPADVLNRRVDSLAADLLDATGEKLGKAGRRSLKEEAKLDLLVKAFPRRTEAFVWISEGRLVIGSTSNAVVDAAVTSLVMSLEGLAVAPLLTVANPGFAMSSWLSEQAAPDHFELGDSCLLVSDAGKVKYTHHTLEIEEVRAHIASGKSASSLALQYGDVSFELSDDLRLKKIEVDDGDGVAKDDFDGNVVIHTEALRGLIDALVEALDGVAE